MSVSPIRWLSGTNTLSKTTSLKSARPVMLRIGWTLIPGVFMSTRNCDSPCRRLSLVEGEVRNRPIIQFALWAPEVQILRPMISQPPADFVASVEAATTYEAEFGYERPSQK